MLLSFTVALLTVVPGQLSLLAAEAPTLPSSARLLTQADSLTPPPLPAEPRLADPEGPELDARIQDMSRQLKTLNRRINALDMEWPALSMLMTGLGSVMVGAVALMPITLMFLDLPMDEGVVFPAIVLGTVGTGLLVAGVLTAEQVMVPAHAERAKLMRERSSLKDELRKLKLRREVLQERSMMPRRRGIQVPLASLSF